MKNGNVCMYVSRVSGSPLSVFLFIQEESLILRASCIALSREESESLPLNKF